MHLEMYAFNKTNKSQKVYRLRTKFPIEKKLNKRREEEEG